MSNVLRILGIVAISMVMGLVALVLLLFTICGGFRGAGAEAGVLVAVCAVLVAGGVAGIVWLGRGLARSQPARGGLAVPPAGGPVAPQVIAAAPPATPAAEPRPRLKGQAFQWLVLLRIALGASAFLIVGSTAISYVSAMQVSPGFALPMFAGAVIGMAPFVLVLVLLRDPPHAVVLDLAAGLGGGSIVFRVLWSAYMSVAWGAHAFAMPAMLGRLALFTAVEAAIVVLALLLRQDVERGRWARPIAIGVGVVVWEWLTQTMVGLLYRFAY